MSLEAFHLILLLCKQMEGDFKLGLFNIYQWCTMLWLVKFIHTIFGTIECFRQIFAVTLRRNKITVAKMHLPIICSKYSAFERGENSLSESEKIWGVKGVERGQISVWKFLEFFESKKSWHFTSIRNNHEFIVHMCSQSLEFEVRMKKIWKMFFSRCQITENLKKSIFSKNRFIR